MKIAILTFPHSPSFGASLQMSALYNVLKSLGEDVYILNYKNRYMKNNKHIGSHRFFYDLLKKILTIPGSYKFKKFERKLIFYPKKTIDEKYPLEKLNSFFDCFICGSDQVWNPNITNFDLNYFLRFVEDPFKRISYAASFGVEQLPKEFCEPIRQQLTKFGHISIRELQAASILENFEIYKYSIVLDPTMLMDRHFWIDNEKKVLKLPEKYIVKFVFNNNEKTNQFISALSKDKGLPVITLGGTVVSFLKRGIYSGPIGPREWLYYIDHATYVVTDSFHGTVFSILFNKEFFVSLNTLTNSRLITLLKTFELDNRIIGSMVNKTSINYDRVNSILNEKKEYSINYIKDAINEIRKGE